MTPRKDTPQDRVAPDTAAPAIVAPDTMAPDTDASAPFGTDAKVAEVVVPAMSDPVSSAEPKALPAARQASRLGILGPLIGGALAAIGGFGLSHFNILGFATSDQTAEASALAQRLETAIAGLEAGQSALEAAQTAAAGEVAARIAALEDAPRADLSTLTDLEERLQTIEALPPGGNASTAALAAKLAEVERRLADLPASGAASAEVDAALARLAEVEAEAKARADAAAAEAEAAAQARARDVLATAAATGAAFDAELAAVANPDLQARLAPFVAGVATLTELQATFPDAARAALQVARATDAEAGWGTKLVDFLGAQTGARSLEPREGDSPDAILSRAEFALGEGRLADALAELTRLSPDVQAPLADWRTGAEARLAVDTALAEGR